MMRSSAPVSADQLDARVRPGWRTSRSAPLISLAASAERCARARTSEATTAKPRPASPARAASTPGVEGQQVGLEGDLFDHADDLADLLRGPGNRLRLRRPPAGRR